MARDTSSKNLLFGFIVDAVCNDVTLVVQLLTDYIYCTIAAFCAGQYLN